MKKILLIFCFLLLAVRSFSQQFSQINTGTLYDSFENPSQRSFIPDSSKKYAFNFLIPNFNVNFDLTGDVQSTLVNRAFGGKYLNTDLQIGNNKYNNVKINASLYALMFKVFGSVNGDSELGFFAETKVDGAGTFSDESVAAFNGSQAFSSTIYDNIFNDHYRYEIYNSIGFSYREKLSKRFAIGFKMSALLGIKYTNLNIKESHITFDNTNDAATFTLRGKYYLSKGPGNVDSRSFLPTTRSPGAQISIGTSYKTEDNITVQGNIKDLGFIHWYNASSIANFDATETATGVSTPKRENNIFGHIKTLLKNNQVYGSFTTATDGKFELSATKSYWLDDNTTIKYSPTLIVSKELFYNGVTGALVNHFQYENYHASLTASYDNNNLLNVGLQFMIKSVNGEFFIGSDKLIQSVALASASKSYSSYSNGSFTGASFFLGFAYKFGPVIEHDMNSSTMNTGEKGFIGRLYNRLFKTNW